MGLQMPYSMFCKFSGVLVTSLITFINYNPYKSPEAHN